MKNISLRFLVSPVSLSLLFFLVFYLQPPFVFGQVIPHTSQPVWISTTPLPATPVSPQWHTGKIAQCLTSPVSLAKPYIGFNGITNEPLALQAWCHSERPEIVSQYCSSLFDSLRSTPVWNLSADCQAVVLARHQEYNEILKFLTP